MEFKELPAAFAAKHGIDGLDVADGAAELCVGGARVELVDDHRQGGCGACRGGGILI